MATRILVVDDSPTIQKVVSTILERSGYDPTIASDGQDAYEVLASGEVKADLVLVDFVMPRMNGYQFCRALRENADLAHMPVVLMSAKGDRIRDQFVEQTGALDAITKPFDSQALVLVIENALRKVNTVRASSARLPDLSDEGGSTGAPTVAGRILSPTFSTSPPISSQPIEYETRRTHVAQIVAQKLANIVTRTIAQRPEVVSSSGLASAISERLSNEAILEMMEVIGDLGRKRSGSLLSGDLGVVPIGAILQLLQAENQTGVLVCTNGSAEVRATFRHGAIDLVQSTNAGDEFRLGRFFIEEGILTPSEIEEITRNVSTFSRSSISPHSHSQSQSAGSRPPLRDSTSMATTMANPVLTPPSPGQSLSDDAPDSRVLPASRQYQPPDAPETLPWGTGTNANRNDSDAFGVMTVPGNAMAEALAAVTAKPRPLGMALLAAGKIVESQLRSALTKQSSELLYEVLRWTAGRFELRREPPTELADQAKLGLPVASVVMEGFRRVDEWRVLERTLGSFDAVLMRDDAAFGALDIQSLPIKERGVLDVVDGDRTVRAIVKASHQSSFDACRILVQFLEARILRKRA